jgi:hypothetical protein
MWVKKILVLLKSSFYLRGDAALFIFWSSFYRDNFSKFINFARIQILFIPGLKRCHSN